MKILIIEDDFTTVEAIKLCMEIYEPRSTFIISHSGLEAIQMLKKDHFDGVIVDLGLPDIDGTEVLKQLRSFSNIPVIVVSARHNQDVITNALAMGANDYITKPFDFRNLLTRLNNLIEQPLTTQENPKKLSEN